MHAHLRPTSIVAAVAALTMAACAQPAADAPAAPPPPPAITQASVEQNVQDLTAALAAGDAAKASAGYTADAVFINARGKVETAAGIEQFWSEAIKGGAGKDLKLQVEKWAASGDMAYTLSRFTGGITAPSGYVLAVSTRQADGTLKVVAQISIPDPVKK